jgi:hypothetical protein
VKGRDTEASHGLPLDDPSVDATDAGARQAIGRQWQERATAELRVASMFSVIAREAFEGGADATVMRLVARAVSDEVRHAEICRLLATRYLGCEVAWPPPGPVPLPPHGTAPDALRPTLHITAMCCINETLASAWLEACRADASIPLARAALRELLADDIDHARIGWAHLASSIVTPDVRSKIAGWLPRLLEASMLPWLTGAGADGYAGFPAHGVPSSATTREVVKSTAREVILVGFEQLGVDTSSARAWMQAHAA